MKIANCKLRRCRTIEICNFHFAIFNLQFSGIA
jgi:hypothetical protein